MRLPLSTYAGGGRETKRREVGFHYEATSTSQSLFPSLPILNSPNLSSNPNTLPQWLPLPKDTHDLHITESHRYFQPYPRITLMSTSLIQHCPRVPQLCSLSAFPHLPTNTLQQAFSYQAQQSSKWLLQRSPMTHTMLHQWSLSVPIFLNLSPAYHSFHLETLSSLAFQYNPYLVCSQVFGHSLSICFVGSISSWLLSVGFPRLGHEPCCLLLFHTISLSVQQP